MFRTRLHAFTLALAVTVALPLSALAQTPKPADPADAFFDDTVVQDIKIAINSKDWQALKDHFRENTYYQCDLKWGDQTVRAIGIRSRGTGSRSGAKPGLRVDFDRYSTDQKFLGLKSFVLRNNVQDASNLREISSMAFFRRMGIVAPREAFARLFVNNVYVGVYTMVESLDKTFLKKNLGENDGYLYEWDFDEQSEIPYSFDYRGSDPAQYVPMPFKPETHEADPHADDVERFLWAVNEAGDAAWRQSMTEFLDLPAFMRRLAIENFLGDEDGISGDYGPNNFYMYRFENKNLLTFLPWDKSNAFWENADYWIFRNIRTGSAAHRNRLVLRALRYTDLMNAYLDGLLESADSAADTKTDTTTTTASAGLRLLITRVATAADTPAAPGWLERQVARYYDLVRSAARADTIKPFSNDEFEEAVTVVKAFVKDRSSAVRQQVAAERPQK